MDKNIKISVIIPSYKTSYEVMKRTVGSILAQDVCVYELIIVDDNDPNEFFFSNKKLMDEYWGKIIVLFNNKNRGANYSRNRGILEAKGDYIAFLDSDDVWSVDYIRINRQMIVDKGAKFITNNYQVVHKEGMLPPEFDEKRFQGGDISRKELYRDYVGPTSTVVVQRQTLIDAGLFDESLPARQDYDMWIRVSKLVPLFYNYKPSVFVYRDGHASISSSYKRNVQGTKMVMDKILNDRTLTEEEKRDIQASQFKHMTLACILCCAYSEAKEYPNQSLSFRFDKNVFVWRVLCRFPLLFTKLREIRKNVLYKRYSK